MGIWGNGIDTQPAVGLYEGGGILKFNVTGLLVFILLFSNLALAESHQSFKTSGRKIETTYYSTEGVPMHATVVLLHGYQCIEACAKDFER